MNEALEARILDIIPKISDMESMPIAQMAKTLKVDAICLEYVLESMYMRDLITFDEHGWREKHCPIQSIAASQHVTVTVLNRVILDNFIRRAATMATHQFDLGNEMDQMKWDALLYRTMSEGNFIIMQSVASADRVTLDPSDLEPDMNRPIAQESIKPKPVAPVYQYSPKPVKDSVFTELSTDEIGKLFRS